MQRTPLRAVPGAICLDEEPLPGQPAAEGQTSFEALRREHHLILNAAGEGVPNVCDELHQARARGSGE